MKFRQQIDLASRFFLLKVCFALALFVPSAGAYSVLSHEEVVDMAWKDNIVPMLKARFPGISDDDIRLAHAYAYGGSVIQDIGYYPFGSKYFSDLLHYVRPEEFVTALIRDSSTPNEYAFALGALAHYCGDTIGHPAINQVTSDENPRLRSRFGQIVTYFEDPTAHVRTEFGFDVVEVAQGHYSQQNYRDFIGFQVTRPLLNRAFEETYGIPVTDVLKHEDLAISTYRRAVSSLIPNMTKLAFVSYKDKIEQAAPGTAKRTFLYRLDRTEYRRDFGNDYQHVSFGGHIVAFLLRFLPKVGPLKALKVTLPNPQQQDVYLKSINATVDKFKGYLGQIHADPAPLPPPDPKDAADARKAAERVARDAGTVQKAADSAKDPNEKAKLQSVAADVQKTSEKASAAAEHTESRVAAAQASGNPALALPAAALPPGSPIQAPSTPGLPHLDLDTGRTSAAGEYPLADQTYARLLNQIVRQATAPARQTPAPGPANATPLNVVASSPAPGKQVDPKLAADIERFFEHPVKSPNPPADAKALRQQAAQAQQVKTDLALLEMQSPQTTP